jgi:hypothetical protein
MGVHSLSFIGFTVHNSSGVTLFALDLAFFYSAAVDSLMYRNRVQLYFMHCEIPDDKPSSDMLEMLVSMY